MIQIGEKKRDYFLVIKNYRKQKQKSQKSPAIKAARVAPHLNVKTRNMMAQEKFMEAQSREAS